MKKKKKKHNILNLDNIPVVIILPEMPLFIIRWYFNSQIGLYVNEAP